MQNETQIEHDLRMKFLLSKYGDYENIPPKLFDADLSSYSDYYYMTHPNCEQLKPPIIAGVPGVIAFLMFIYFLAQIIDYLF